MKKKQRWSKSLPKQVKSPKRRPPIKIALLFLVISVILIGVYSSRARRDETKSLSDKWIPATYSVQEMQQIWTNNFQEFLDQGLLANKSPFPKIQERYNLLISQIGARFHTNVNIHLVTTYCPDSTNILAGCWVTNQLPQLDIIVPRLTDLYYEFQAKRDPEWKTTICNILIVSVMHECDHLALGIHKGDRQHPQSFEELVNEETKVWALTCEYSLRPMIEDYNAPLSYNEHVYYNKWIEAGCDENSPIWKNFIRSIYQQTRE